MLKTPKKIREFQRKLYLKAKRSITVNAFKKKIIGKPYEGKPHVRFDEGELKTGQHLWSAVAACRENSKGSSVTASALYSTVKKYFTLYIAFSVSSNMCGPCAFGPSFKPNG